MTALRYSGFPCSFTYGSAQTLSFQQLGSVDHDSGCSMNDIVPSGALDRAAVVLKEAQHVSRISTPDLLTVLGVVSGTTGLACNGTCTFRSQRRADSGTFAGGTTNLTGVAQTGFLAPDSIAASGNSPAEISLSFWPLFDGTNDPLKFTDSVNLGGAPQPAYASEYYLGPVYLIGAQVLGLLSTRINFGIQFSPFTADGDLFPRSGAIIARRPSIELTLTKLNWLTGQFASMYNNASGGTVALYFVQGSPGGGRTAYGSSVHCKISATTSAGYASKLAHRDNADGTVTVRIMPTTTLGVSIASTIP